MGGGSLEPAQNIVSASSSQHGKEETYRMSKSAKEDSGRGCRHTQSCRLPRTQRIYHLARSVLCELSQSDSSWRPTVWVCYRNCPRPGISPRLTIFGHSHLQSISMLFEQIVLPQGVLAQEALTSRRRNQACTIWRHMAAIDLEILLLAWVTLSAGIRLSSGFEPDNFLSRKKAPTHTSVCEPGWFDEVHDRYGG